MLTQEEKHNQRFRQLSVEFSIHFVYFILPYRNPLPLKWRFIHWNLGFETITLKD